MIKLLLGPALLCGLVVTAAPASAQRAQCDRGDLEAMTNAYIAAQTSGDPLKLPLTEFTVYTEQGEDATMVSGMLSTPLRIDFHRTLFDVPTCSTFTEVVAADPAHPYVIGTRLQFAGHDNPIAADRVNEINLVVTGKDDRLFDAGKTLRYSKAENWGAIPVAERDSRATIIAAANAYLDSLGNKSVAVPWGTPCALLEGGLYSGKAAGSEERCDAGLPAAAKVAERRYIVDETLGAVAVLLLLGQERLADVHTFRVERGRIRYVHAMTACKRANCGLPVSEEMKRRLRD